MIVLIRPSRFSKAQERHEIRMIKGSMDACLSQAVSEALLVGTLNPLERIKRIRLGVSCLKDNTEASFRKLLSNADGPARV